MTSRACVDSSLAVMWLIPTRGETLADALLAGWDRDGTDIVAPPLLEAEISSMIRRQVYLNRLLPRQGEDAFALFCRLGIRIANPPDLQRRAWELASSCNLPLTYDMQYLAIAETEDCELWTARERLFSSLKGKTSRVRLLGGMSDVPLVHRGIRAAGARGPSGDDFPGLWQKL